METLTPAKVIREFRVLEQQVKELPELAAEVLAKFGEYREELEARKDRRVLRRCTIMVLLVVGAGCALTFGLTLSGTVDASHTVESLVVMGALFGLGVAAMVAVTDPTWSSWSSLACRAEAATRDAIHLYGVEFVDGIIDALGPDRKLADLIGALEVAGEMRQKLFTS